MDVPIEEDPEIKELLIILSQTFSSTTTRQIKEAEEKLKQFDQIIINKINKIFQLFSSNKIPLPNKKALAIRVKYIFISYGKDKNLELNTLQQYIELLINTLIDNKKIKDIPLSVIDQICEALKFLINSKLLKNNEILLTKLSQSIINKINLSNSFIIFSFLYLIVLSPNTNINNINEIINDNFINAIKKYITTRIDINQTIKILDLLSLSLKKLLYLGQAKFMIGNIIKNLYDYLFRIFLDHCTGEKSYVSLVSKYNQNDEEQIKQKAKTNLLKSKIFLVISFMIECDKSINNDNSIQDKILIAGLIQMIKIILGSLDYIIKEELTNLEQFYKQANYEIIIYQSFSLFNKCISSAPFKQEFYSSAKNFIFFKIFPFFTVNFGETELFKESPDEYYLQVIDTMTEFSFKKIKTICGKSLTLICENYPDLSFVVLNTIFELLIFFMEEFERKNIYKYTLINNEIGEFFIDNYRNESVIDISLLCISILAKQAMINAELKKSLHKFLLDNQMRLENVGSAKIQFKLCLLYGLFLDALFDINNKEDIEFIKTAINYLLSIILYYNKVKEINGLSYQAFHSIEQIIENPDLCDITNELVKFYYEQMLQSIPDSNLLIFFDMINLFIEKIPVIRDNIVIVTNYIIEKIKNDLKELKKGNDNDGILANFVHKELAIVGNIINNFEKNEIELKICEFIVNFIKNDGNNEFIEKIINLIVNYSSKKTKSNLVKQMINDSEQIIHGYYNTSHYIDLPSFKILNYLIVNNPKENNKIISLVKNIIIDSLQRIEDNFYGQENIIYTLSLIICWLISKVSNNVDNNIIYEIENITLNIITLVYNKLCKLYEKDKIENDTDNNFLKYFYIVIIYSSFIYHSKNTFQFIYDKNFFINLLKYTNDIMIITNTYFSLKINKLIIFGLSKILYENEFLKMIIVYFKDAFSINYNLISKQLFEEVKESKMKSNINIIKYKESNDNENDNENVNENNNEEKNYLVKKINDIINKELVLCKLDFDEYDIFSKLYKKLIEINETKLYINEIIEKMDNEAKKDFENILKIKKINIIKENGKDMMDDGSEETVHRRIVKIKHNNKYK